jgi:hypothetical protein
MVVWSDSENYDLLFAPTARMGTMTDTLPTPAAATADDRAARLQDLLDRLRPAVEEHLRRLAERLVDLPEEQAFGQVEYDLRDLAHELAATSHQAGLEAGKKRGTRVPASSARTAAPTPASSSTAPRPG